MSVEGGGGQGALSILEGFSPAERKSNFFLLFLFLFKMAATSFKEAYNAVFSNRPEQLKDPTTVDEVRKLYDDWATKYDKVRLLVLATAYLEQGCH